MNYDSLSTENQTQSHQFFILRWHSSTRSLWSPQELKSQPIMIRERHEMVQRGCAVGASEDQSKMEERMVQQDGEKFWDCSDGLEGEA